MNGIAYSYKKSLRELQNEKEKKYLKEFEEGKFTFEDPLVIENPYLINPLAVLILFENKEMHDVTLTVYGKDVESTLTHVFSSEEKQFISVLGLYANDKTRVTLKKGGVEKEFWFSTDISQFENAPSVVSLKKDPDFKAEGMLFYSSALRELPTAVDNNGDVRWIFTIPMQWQARLLMNGHLLIGTERQLIQPYYVTGCYEIDFNGRIYKEYRIPDGYHHDFVEMEDGNLLIATDDMKHHMLEDQVVLIDRATGEVIRTWCMRDIMNPNEGLGSKALPDDWFHNNALQYDKATNSITLSARHIDAIVNIDYDSGKLNWILGDPETWSEESRKYFFTPVGDDFEWPYAPHSCVVVNSTDIYCFDNGCARSKIPENYRANPDNYSRGVHYKIDVEKMEIRQIWQYGKERGSEFFSMYISNIDPYNDASDKRILVHSGGTALDNGVAWDRIYVPVLIKEATTEPYAYTVELEDGREVFELKLRGNYYRAIRMNLYNNGYQFSLSTVNAVGHFMATEIDHHPDNSIQAEESVPAEKQVRFVEEDDRLTVLAYVKMRTEVGILLKKDDDERYYKVPTDLRPLVRLIQSGGEVDEGYSIVTRSVMKAGLSGKYDVSILLENKEYTAGFSIKGEE